MIGEHHWKWLKTEDLSGYTLIVPSVAVGNVGQLACDLLISSLSMDKIASIYTPAQIPVIGCDPYDRNSTTLSTSCELFKASSHNLLVLQMKAPLVFKYAREFLENIVEKFQEKNIKDMIILTSSYAHERKYIMTSPFRYIVYPLTHYKLQIVRNNMIDHDQQIENEIKIFGGGFATMLFSICKEKSLPCFLLYKYCSEGDNIPDGIEMVKQLHQLIEIFEKDRDISAQIIQPESWKLLFGRPPPQDIY
ncbi:proteasome assembly chaperone 2 [Zerene cesonia]|uniref:proteasome assembly chaperone 2 n=1 Tax=Zerene cesonia TaxID=33412 RepID=UPI0018E5244D|nr:proteasome assembly chaperone 2 [Zerene cesonia]